MTNKKNKIQIENKITERVFSNDNKSLQELLTKYLNNKVEKAIKGLYDCNEVKATLSEREVA